MLVLAMQFSRVRAKRRAWHCGAGTVTLRGGLTKETSLKTEETRASGQLELFGSASGLRLWHSKSALLRKEVIQPHLPVRLPCYDFTPIANPTFGSSLPCGLGH